MKPDSSKWQEKRQWAQIEIQDIPCRHKKKKKPAFFYHKGDQTLEQAAKKSHGVLILGDTRNPARHSPGKLAFVDPALSRVVGPGDLQRSLPSSNIL